MVSDAPVAAGPIDELIQAYAAARSAREDSDARTKRLRVAEEAAERELFDELERQNLRSARHALGLFGLNDTAWAAIEDRDAARIWAEAEAPELITLNSQRLSAMIRERLREGDDLPPGVGYTVSRKINWRRAGASERIEGGTDGGDSTSPQPDL